MGIFPDVLTIQRYENCAGTACNIDVIFFQLRKEKVDELRRSLLISRPQAHLHEVSHDVSKNHIAQALIVQPKECKIERQSTYAWKLVAIPQQDQGLHKGMAHRRMHDLTVLTENPDQYV